MHKIKVVALLLFLASFTLSSLIIAQDKEPRKSPKAKVSQTIGIDTEVTFEFSRPSVKGRTIWGELVPWGFEPGNKYSDNKPYPWRGGANENTTIEFSSDLVIEGNKISAGKYSLHFNPGKKEWNVIFNSVNDQWGSYKYDSSKDVVTFKVTPVEATHQESLIYGFDNYNEYQVNGFLHWEKLMVPFKIEVAN
jgi:Protein of unknown function (DUF2911)